MSSQVKQNILTLTTNPMFKKAVKKFEKVIYTGKTYGLIESCKEYGNSYLKFTNYTQGIAHQLMILTESKFRAIPQLTYVKKYEDPVHTDPESPLYMFKGQKVGMVLKSLDKFLFKRDDFIFDQEGFEWKTAMEAGIQQSKKIFSTIENCSVNKAYNGYHLMNFNSDVKIEGKSIKIPRPILITMAFYPTYIYHTHNHIDIQVFGYNQSVIWRHFLDVIDTVHYSDQDFTYLFKEHKVEKLGCIRVGKPPFCPVLEKFAFYSDAKHGIEYKAIVAVCDLNRLLMCTLIEKFNDDGYINDPSVGQFRFGPHSAPYKALIQYFRDEDRLIALRLDMIFKTTNIPTMIEKKFSHPHEAVMLDSRRGFPFIVSIRPETALTGIVGLFCTYTQISEMCDIRNVVSQVYVYNLTDV